jgi:hypothetical protein
MMRGALVRGALVRGALVRVCHVLQLNTTAVKNSKMFEGFVTFLFNAYQFSLN